MSAMDENNTIQQDSSQIDSASSVADMPLSDSSQQAVPSEPSEEDQNPTLALFMSACQNGDLDTVKELISSGSVLATDSFSQGITGLHWAAINNRITVVRYLVDNEYSTADPNALGGNLQATPLHWACRNGLVYVVDYFLKHGGADPTIRDSQRYNALHLAVHSSNITLVVYILLKCVAIDKTIYIDDVDNIGCTALHWAAYQGDILTVNALLRFGADVSKVDNSMMTPLHWAFIRGYKLVLAALVEAGADIFAQNDKGKDSFGVAKDMNCEQTWNQVLVEADRNRKRNWEPNSHLLSPKAAKIITYFVPFIVLPVVLNTCSFSQGDAIVRIVSAVIVAGIFILWLQKSIIPIYLRRDKAIFQSPFLAGVFSATTFWCVVTWVYSILPLVWWDRFFVNVGLVLSIVVLSYAFSKSMSMNPGHVPVPTDSHVVLEQVEDLIRVGKFDTEHFCVNSFIRRPLRSKYSRSSGRLIARFDHSCPWVYNDIGVRNHKVFITFTYALAAAIVFYSLLALKYFDEFGDKQLGYDSDVECSILSDDLCAGYTNNPFIFNLTIWSWFQLVWVVSLCAVQTFQIFKGVTTWEFSTLSKRITSPMYNHSTLPTDFNGPNSAQGPPNTTPGTHSHSHNGLGICMKLLGMDQLLMTIKMAILSIFNKTSRDNSYSSLERFEIPTDYGWKQNWRDFWFLGDIEWRNVLLLPIDGENNLNGKVVDYYKLYEYPSKHSGPEIV